MTRRDVLGLTLPLLAGGFRPLTAARGLGKYNEVLTPGDQAPAWSQLPGTDDRKHSLSDLAAKKVIVVVFTCNSCPVAIDYEGRIGRFAAERCRQADPVALVAINVNVIEADRLPRMQDRAKAQGFTFPYLFDETQKIAKSYGATFTPEFFVLTAERTIAYLGAMDDHNDPKKAKINYVDLAVDAALAGRRPEKTETAGRGCKIRYVQERRKKPPSE